MSNYTEEARDLREQLVLEDALQAATKPIWKIVAKHETFTEFQPFQATKEPFLSLQREGWMKHEIRCRWASGLVFAVHLWVSPTGERGYPKIVDSPLDQSGYIPIR